MKVAFQAGVLQVWLDEAGLDFDLADGCSGGCLNLAMYCQGMSGTRIADNWRRYRPLDAIDPNWGQYLKLVYAESLFELDAFRERVFPAWGLDVDRIRASDRAATFNVYNFSRHELAVLTPDRMTEDHLVASISLPMWFPPVTIDGDTYIDSVFITDANLEEAIRRGADELWIIWTVSRRDEWHDGFVPNYFQIIETSANGHLRRMLARIEANNAALAAGGEGAFGRRIDVKMLEAEVDVHYLINFSADRIHEAVNAGVQAARDWCAARGIPLDGAAPASSSPDAKPPTSLRFTETMKGFVTFGATDYDRGYRRGRADHTACAFRLTITMEDIDRFITDPDHEAAATGYVEGEAWGGRQPVERGIFNLFVRDDSATRTMRYRLFFHDADGAPRTLVGFKEIKDDPGFDAWADTTTLFTRILDGHAGPDEEDAADVLAAGILRIHLTDFLEQLTTFRADGPSLAARTSARLRFGQFFLGKLWDVYAREFLS